ncbi:Zn-dependent protease with chaperone function [Acinetobacter calcoaceticus]|uniref:Zn-dependent protease with chaperone function n=1 Tax=Acinetobacter calcoaceticus TaxID=471 RepID=A0A4R1XHA2_ACICA|nr:Zn-dependent protease with chaperone function [Acinetobacter calcoaceticus]
MQTYQVDYHGEVLDIIQVCKRVIVANSGKIRTVDSNNGVMTCTFTYGINLNGLKMSLRFNQSEPNYGQIFITAEFTNSADFTGIADKKAGELAEKINQQLQSPESFSSTYGISDVVLGLNQVKKTSILSWTIIVLIGLAISAIPTGFGIVLVPLVGLVGAVIGLPFSRWLAKRAHQVVTIERHNNAHHDSFWLYDLVAELAQKADIPMPEVGIYESSDMNAFASGATPNSSVIAFSTALLEQMDIAEIQAVTAHEIGHIISNDMRGMALLSGLITSFILVFTLPLQGLRLINFFSNSTSIVVEVFLWAVKAVLAVVMTFLGSLIVKMYSRKREYKADAIASLLVGKEPMIRVLSKLAQETETIPIQQRGFNSFKISNSSNLSEIFSTHPSLEKRIQALEFETHSPF